MAEVGETSLELAKMLGEGERLARRGNRGGADAVRVAEERADEVRVAELRAVEDRPDVWIPLPPLIPSLSTFQEYLYMLVVRHRSSLKQSQCTSDS